MRQEIISSPRLDEEEFNIDSELLLDVELELFKMLSDDELELAI